MIKETADNLAKTYGGRSYEVCEYIHTNIKSEKERNDGLIVRNFPYIDAEIRFACREYACTIEDVLSRRTRLAFLDKDAAISAIPRVADIMAEELGWSEAMKSEQMRIAREYVGSYAGRSP